MPCGGGVSLWYTWLVCEAVHERYIPSFELREVNDNFVALTHRYRYVVGRHRVSKEAPVGRYNFNVNEIAARIINELKLPGSTQGHTVDSQPVSSWLNLEVRPWLLVDLDNVAKKVQVAGVRRGKVSIRLVDLVLQGKWDIVVSQGEAEVVFRWVIYDIAACLAIVDVI